MWVGLADASGRVQLDELPTGAYYLNVLSHHLVAADASSSNHRLQIPAGVVRLTVTLQEPFAAVFECPSKSKVANVAWDVDLSALDLSAPVTSRLLMVRQSVEKRFPGCLAYVHVPIHRDRTFEVGCYVTVEDKTHWWARQALTPLSQIAGPIFLEQDLRPVRDIVVHVVDAAGSEYEGIPIVLRNREERSAFSTCTGSSCTLPYGTYKINAKVLDPEIYRALHDFSAKVEASSPADLFVRVSVPLHEVLVNVHYPSSTVVAPLEVYFDNEAGQGPAVVNYRPERGPIRRRLAGESLSVKVRSLGYEDVDIPSRPMKAGEVTVFDVALQERKIEGR